MQHIRKPTRQEWNNKELRISKINWDIVVHNIEHQAVQIYDLKDNGLYHCIGGKFGENNYYVYPLFFKDQDELHSDHKIHPITEDLIFDHLVPFNGHAGATWGFKVEEKQSTRKGEIRSNIELIITRNNKTFYEEFYGDLAYASNIAQLQIAQFQEHPIWFNERNWQKYTIDRPVWWKGNPGIITDLIESQGCVMISPDQKFIESFPGNHEESRIKTTYLDPNIGWFRGKDDMEEYISEHSTRPDIIQKLFKLHTEGKISDDVYFEIQKYEMEKL